jgi:hypothetical protein
VDHVEIAVEGVDRPLKGRTREGVPAPPTGEIGVYVDPAEVLVFDASEA